MGCLKLKIGNFEVMNSRQSRIILKLLKEQWGFQGNIEEGMLQKEDDIFLVSRSVGDMNLKDLRINSLGLYFGELKHGQLRLSIEGSQIIGPHSTKNVIELDHEQIKKWLSGENLELSSESSSKFVIVKHEQDFFGCGRIKENILLNFLPKSRRLILKNHRF